MASNGARVAVAALTLSAVGFVTYIGYEDWSATATPPVPGDVNTYGFGSTRDAEGRPLKGGEKISPPQALRLALRDVTAQTRGLKKCLAGVSLYQHEYDALSSLALNVGAQAVCASSIPAKAHAGAYTAMCRTILDFDGFCARPKVKNADGEYVCPPGALKKLPGLTKRRQAETRQCLGENNG